MSRLHSLKTWPPFFREVRAGRKRFEIRVNDRDFAVGDCLVLQEYEPAAGRYTGEMESVRVTYLVQGEWGLPRDVCVMSIEPWAAAPSPQTTPPDAGFEALADAYGNATSRLDAARGSDEWIARLHEEWTSARAALLSAIAQAVADARRAGIEDAAKRVAELLASRDLVNLIESWTADIRALAAPGAAPVEKATDEKESSNAADPKGEARGVQDRAGALLHARPLVSRRPASGEEAGPEAGRYDPTMHKGIDR